MAMKIVKITLQIFKYIETLVFSKFGFVYGTLVSPRTNKFRRFPQFFPLKKFLATLIALREVETYSKPIECCLYRLKHTERLIFTKAKLVNFVLENVLPMPLLIT